MVKVVPFHPEHLQRIRLQPRQRTFLDFAPPGLAEQLATRPSISVMDGDEVLLSGGIIELWTGRGLCWAYMAEGIGGRMTAVVRAASRFIAAHAPARLEMDTEIDHAEGHRLAKVLGFRLETPRLERYYPNGNDGALYVRIAA